MEDRPKHFDKLRRKLQRFRDLRERDRNRYDAKASALWEHAMEARPMLYRHLLLEELSSSAECQAVTPPAEWSESIINDALKTRWRNSERYKAEDESLVSAKLCTAQEANTLR